MNTDGIIVMFALIAALGLIGVIAVDYFTLPKAAAFGVPGGCAFSGTGFNASKGRCF